MRKTLYAAAFLAALAILAVCFHGNPDAPGVIGDYYAARAAERAFDENAAAMRDKINRGERWTDEDMTRSAQELKEFHDADILWGEHLSTGRPKP